MTTNNHYSGSCHCGKVQYEFTGNVSDVIACNCSICSRAGYLLTFIGADDFKLLSGDDEQTDYQFNKKHIHHVFCKTCGVRSFGHGTDQAGNTVYSVNVRCLEGVDIDKLKVQHYDGKSM